MIRRDLNFLSQLVEAGAADGQGLGPLALYLMILAMIDLTFLRAYYPSAVFRNTFSLWMLFEFLGITVASISNICKVAILFVDVSLQATETEDDNRDSPAQTGGWQFKNGYIFAVEVTKEVTELVVFMGFLTLFFLANPSRPPIYLASDLFQVVRSLAMRVQSYTRYKHLASRIDVE